MLHVKLSQISTSHCCSHTMTLLLLPQRLLQPIITCTMSITGSKADNRALLALPLLQALAVAAVLSRELILFHMPAGATTKCSICNHINHVTHSLPMPCMALHHMMHCTTCKSIDQQQHLGFKSMYTPLEYVHSTAEACPL